MRKLIPIVGVILLISGCSVFQGGSQSGAIVVAQKSVYTTKASFTAALQLADIYAKLPRCNTAATPNPTAPPACSDQTVLDQMVKAEKAADASIQSAENVVRDPRTTQDVATAAQNAAAQALTALTTIMNTYGIKSS